MFECSDRFLLSLRFSCFGFMDGLGYQVQACDSRHKGSNARSVRRPVVNKEITSGLGRSFEVPSVLSHCLFGSGNGILPIKICTTYPKRLSSTSPDHPGKQPLQRYMWICG